MAGDLETGDRILALDGSYGTVEALEVVERVQSMYDLTVAEAHTFAVGEGRWVVHNACNWQPLGGFTNDIRSKGFHFNWVDRGRLQYEVTLIADEVTGEIITSKWPSGTFFSNRELAEIQQFLENNRPQAIVRADVMEDLADTNGWDERAWEASVLRRIFEEDALIVVKQ